jgi:hypothetical protein
LNSDTSGVDPVEYEARCVLGGTASASNLPWFASSDHLSRTGNSSDGAFNEASDVKCRDLAKAR